jgi:N-methylhydantoinase A
MAASAQGRRRTWTVGVDIGGTFTDVVATRADSGELRAAKTPTRPGAAESSIVAGLAAVGLDWADAAEVVLGTTMVTNAIVAGDLAPVALVATEGFGDTLEIGRQNRRELYRLDVPPKLPPLVPAARRLEAKERIGPDGRVVVPLDEAEIGRIAERVAGLGVSAVAVALQNGYANGGHETRLGDRLKAAVPHVALSHEIAPEPREFERTSVTVLAAALMPLVAERLGRLRDRAAGTRLSLFHSAGGMASLDAVARRPVALALSGPAAGAAAAGRIARELGLEAAIGFDMGGTTTDACLVLDGEVQVSAGRSLAGRPLRQVMVAVESIGAGGGSVVRLDGRAVRVGPDSAGAVPGPACYGLGGERATVTDADLVLGFLGRDRPLGGAIRLDDSLARRALAPVAEAFGVSVEETALGVRRVVGAGMIRALRRVTVERGVDARRCTLLAFGGAGPMHGVALARELGIERVVVPRFSSEFSALGCLTAAARYTEQRVLRMPSTAWDERRIAAVADEVGRRLADRLGDGSEGTVRLVGLVHYLGQSDTVEVPITLPAEPACIGREFMRRHRELYGFATDEPWHLDTLRIEVTGPPRVGALAPPRPEGPAQPRVRNCWFDPSGATPTPCHDRAALGPDATITGPAIVEDAWSTIVLEPGSRARIDGSGHVHIEVGR